jgi:hypothetical protein
MMLVIQGYFEAGQFISDTPVVIPENKKTIITVLDENIQKTDQKKMWGEFREAIEKSNEELSDYIPRLNLTRKADL